MILECLLDDEFGDDLTDKNDEECTNTWNHIILRSKQLEQSFTMPPYSEKYLDMFNRNKWGLLPYRDCERKVGFMLRSIRNSNLTMDPNFSSEIHKYLLVKPSDEDDDESHIRQMANSNEHAEESVRYHIPKAWVVGAVHPIIAYIDHNLRSSLINAYFDIYEEVLAENIILTFGEKLVDLFLESENLSFQTVEKLIVLLVKKMVQLKVYWWKYRQDVLPQKNDLAFRSGEDVVKAK